MDSEVMNKEKSKRSRFNEIGTLDYVNESSVVRAASLVKKGIVLSLAHTYEIDMPTVWFHGHSFTQILELQKTLLGCLKNSRTDLAHLFVGTSSPITLGHTWILSIMQLKV